MGISVADLPSLSPLVRDYYFAFDEVREFFNGDFRDSAAYERQMGRLASRKYARGRLAEILSEQNRSSGCGPRTLQNIEALVQDDACAVVTGQQVALFSGPSLHDLQSLDCNQACRLPQSADRCARCADFLAGHGRSRFCRGQSRRSPGSNESATARILRRPSIPGAGCRSVG